MIREKMKKNVSLLLGVLLLISVVGNVIQFGIAMTPDTTLRYGSYALHTSDPDKRIFFGVTSDEHFYIVQGRELREDQMCEGKLEQTEDNLYIMQVEGTVFGYLLVSKRNEITVIYHPTGHSETFTWFSSNLVPVSADGVYTPEG